MSSFLRSALVLCLLGSLSPGFLAPMYSQQVLSPAARASLLTSAPGGELYATFGHTSFRISDPVNGVDETYNYGTFNFRTPNFYLKFIQGKLLYRLSTEPYYEFEYYYTYKKRGVVEQVLDLSPKQVQKLSDFLQQNARPENREYLYDYFFNNCATKPRDVIIEVLGDSLKWENLYESTGKSFRDIIGPYLEDKAWAAFGISLLLGLDTDRKASYYEQMFIPDFLQQSLERARVVTPSGFRPVVKETHVIVPRSDFSIHRMDFTSPFIIFAVLLAIVCWVSFKDLQNRRLSKWLDIVLFGLSGIAGIVMIFMWLGTDHSTTDNNLNLIWALPTNLIFLFAYARKRVAGWCLPYIVGIGGILTIAILTFSIFPQQFHLATLLFMLSLLVRSVCIFLAIRRDKKTILS